MGRTSLGSGSPLHPCRRGRRRQPRRLCRRLSPCPAPDANLPDPIASIDTDTGSRPCVAPLLKLLAQPVRQAVHQFRILADEARDHALDVSCSSSQSQLEARRVAGDGLLGGLEDDAHGFVETDPAAQQRRGDVQLSWVDGRYRRRRRSALSRKTLVDIHRAGVGSSSWPLV